MYKYRKILLYFLTLAYIILTIIELTKYLALYSTIYGLIYLIASLLLIFILIPTTINYKNNYSMTRFSKFMIIIILGIFNSFILNHIVFSNLHYLDSSYEYLGSIRYIKNIFKPFIYCVILLISLRECKVYEKLFKLIKKS